MHEAKYLMEKAKGWLHRHLNENGNAIDSSKYRSTNTTINSNKGTASSQVLEWHTNNSKTNDTWESLPQSNVDENRSILHIEMVAPQAKQGVFDVQETKQLPHACPPPQQVPLI